MKNILGIAAALLLMMGITGTPAMAGHHGLRGHNI